MARKFLTSIDLNTSELQNAVIQNLASDPTSGNKDGRIYFNTETEKIRIYIGESWMDVGAIVDVEGTEDQISVNVENGIATIGLTDSVNIADDLEVGRDLTVLGDFTVSGTTTFINTEDLNVKDNIITLNSGTEGEPTLNAGIEIDRGESPTVTLQWNESSDTWEATRDGNTFSFIVLDGDIVGSDTIDVSSNDGVITVDTILKEEDSYLLTENGLAVDISSIETDVLSAYTKKVSANVGDGASTSFAIEHSLNTRDVVVNVYDNATYDTVETDVVRTDADNVTVSFASAPSNNAYRVVVIG
jgi:hypothetical protein